jgi:MFS family permease
MSRVSAVSSRGWQHLYRFYAYHLTAQTGFFSAVWILYLQHRGYSLAEIGLAEAAFHLAPVLLEIPSGSFADLVGRRWSLVVSSSLVLLANLCMWQAGSLPVVMLALFLHGASMSFRSGADQAYLYEALNAEQRSRYGRLFGRLLSAGYLIGGVTTWIGALLSERSYAIPISLAIVVALCGILLAFGLEEPPREAASRHRRGLRGHAADVRAVLRAQPAIAMMMLIAAVYWTMLTIADLYAQAVFADRGMSNGRIGLIIGLTAVAIAAGTAIGGHLRGAFTRQWAWLTIGTGLGVALISVDAVVLAIIAFIGAQLVSGMAETLLSAWYNDQLPSAQRATVLSVESWLFSCFMIVLFPLGGWLAGQAGWSALYLVCGVAAGATALAAVVVRAQPGPATESERIVASA